MLLRTGSISSDMTILATLNVTSMVLFCYIFVVSKTKFRTAETKTGEKSGNEKPTISLIVLLYDDANNTDTNTILFMHKFLYFRNYSFPPQLSSRSFFRN